MKKLTVFLGCMITPDLYDDLIKYAEKHSGGNESLVVRRALQSYIQHKEKK